VPRLLLLAAVAVLVLGLAARATRREETPPSPYCRPGDPLAGVYHPSRLKVRKRCVQVSGTVAKTKREDYDGDVHVTLDTDAGERLVVEIVPQDRSRVPIPDTGSRVTVVGPRVYDTTHDWDEVHPAWWISSGRIVPASPRELERARRLLEGRYAGTDAD
jgi:hypothetical protein